MNWWRLILRGKIRSKGKAIAGQKIGTVKRVLSEDEVGELIAWLPNFPIQIADVLTLYLWTGARGAEIVGMTGAEMTEENDQAWWTIPKSRTKNARHEEVRPINGHPYMFRGLAVVLRRKRLYGGGVLFPSRQKAGHVDQKTLQQQVHWLARLQNQPSVFAVGKTFAGQSRQFFAIIGLRYF